jgi:outer membrane protein assembly factor BamB
MKTVRALVGAGGLALAGCWPVPGQNADRTSHNPFERAVTVDNVDGLQEAWRANFGGSDLAGPVVSSRGVHVGVWCGLWTLDPKTGESWWGEQIAPELEPICLGGVARQHAGAPHVASDGERVAASIGFTSVQAPGSLESAWATTVFDLGSGAVDGSAEVGFLQAQRGTRLAGLTTEAVGPGMQATSLRLAEIDGPEERSFRTAIAPARVEFPEETVTLGRDTVFHAGHGILATEPGEGAHGDAVRAFSLTEPRPGCGPVTAPQPFAGSYDVECPVWVQPTDGLPSAPVLRPGYATLYVRTDGGTLYSLDADTGAVLWTAGGLGSAGGPALADGTLYVPTGDGRVVTFPADGCGQATCAPTGEFATGTTGAASKPVVAGTVLYVTAGGSVVAFDAAGCPSGPCAPLWSAPGESPPVVSNGRVYVRSDVALVAYALPPP